MTDEMEIKIGNVMTCRFDSDQMLKASSVIEKTKRDFGAEAPQVLQAMFSLLYVTKCQVAESCEPAASIGERKPFAHGSTTT